MTLIVARKLGNCIWISGDTLVSDEKAIGASKVTQLKIFAIDPSTMLAFAGSSQHAIRILSSSITTLRDAETQRVIEFLASSTQEIAIDFILARAGSLTLIRNNIVETDLSNCWIGDIEAFHAFRELEASDVGPSQRPGFNPHIPVPTGMADLFVQRVDTVCGATHEDFSKGRAFIATFQKLLQQPKILTVGGEIVTAIIGKNFARYHSYSLGHSPPYPLKEDEWVPAAFSGPADGGYCATTIVPVEPGIAGWGVFYHQGSYGKYYAAELERNSYELLTGSAANAEEFCDCLNAELKYQVEHCGSWN